MYQTATGRSETKASTRLSATHTRVIGFYQRCGYTVEPRAVLSKRLDGIALALAQQGHDEPVVITYLAMNHKPVLARIEPKIKRHALLKCHRPSLSFYRYLYDAVGRMWFWTDRKRLSDSELTAVLSDPQVDVYVLYADAE